jgi:hypothetical protein
MLGVPRDRVPLFLERHALFALLGRATFDQDSIDTVAVHIRCCGEISGHLQIDHQPIALLLRTEPLCSP